MTRLTYANVWAFVRLVRSGVVPYHHLSKPIILLGIAFDEEKRNLVDWKEERVVVEMPALAVRHRLWQTTQQLRKA